MTRITRIPRITRMAQRLGKLLVFGILLSSAGGAQSVRLAWDPVPEYWIAGYHLYRSPQEGGPWQRVNLDLIPETWYLDETVESGETWYYSVTAVNTFGAESALSTPVRVVVGGSRPAVSLGADRDAVTGEVVILTAQVTGFASAPTYAWEQTAGPPAAMVSPTPGTLVFTAPETETEIVLEFRVRADTSPGESALSSLRIRILPRP